MEQEYGGTREAFAALGKFRGNAEGLYAASRGVDFDIDLSDWIASAAPASEVGASAQVEGWASAWIYCSRWAGTVGRRPPFASQLTRAGIGLWLEETQDRVLEMAQSWNWPGIEELESSDLSHLEASYALLHAVSPLSLVLPVEPAFDPDEDEVAEPWAAQEEQRAWSLALVLELGARGQLPRIYTELSEYDGAARITITPTQLYTDAFGRVIPKSRQKKILDEWCDFFESSPTPIRFLDIASRAPKRLITALRGQTQVRGLSIKWGDYDDLSALATMPDLWTAELGGASALMNLDPLRAAQSLRFLRLGDSRRVADYSALGALANLEELEFVTGMGSATFGIPNINFLREMPSLRHLSIAARVLDNDYSPLLDRTTLESLWVLKQKTMSPSYNELVLRIPALR